MQKKFLIIIVDDDKDDQYLIRQAISETGVHSEVASVYNGLQLMDYLQHKGVYSSLPDTRPDLILLDINMPLLNGFGVLEALQNDVELKDIPVYILTTSKNDADRRRALESGANGFYTKPVNYNQLKMLIKEVTATALV